MFKTWKKTVINVPGCYKTGFFLVWIFLGYLFLPYTAHTFHEMRPKEKAFHAIIARAADRYRVEIELVKAMIMVESRFDARAVSDSGARGLMQLMPETAESLGVKDCFDPEQNINAGVRYFKNLKAQFNGNIILALAAYNAGPSRVKKCGGIPKMTSTRKYIIKVLQFYRIYKRDRHLEGHEYKAAIPAAIKAAMEDEFLPM